MNRTQRVGVLVVMLGAGCGEQAASSPAGAKSALDPAAWLGGPPSLSGSADVGVLGKSGAALGECMQKAATVFPCSAELTTGRASFWARPEGKVSHAIIVLRDIPPGASACLEKETPGKALSASVAEHVRFGAQWPRVYTFREGGAETWLLAKGKGVQHARDILASDARAPANRALPTGIMFDVQVSDGMAEVLGGDDGAELAEKLAAIEVAVGAPVPEGVPVVAKVTAKPGKGEEVASLARQIASQTKVAVQRKDDTFAGAVLVPPQALAARCKEKK